MFTKVSFEKLFFEFLMTSSQWSQKYIFQNDVIFNDIIKVQILYIFFKNWIVKFLSKVVLLREKNVL